uniref:Uncharacterized protein n=1 Tax=Physcomitrium patens TaxID=3218 RepID=A0A2K1JTR7_PHYPA|nr:hypothetical protein PHYPA_014695 [Physcomitrium patens]
MFPRGLAPVTTPQAIPSHLSSSDLTWIPQVKVPVLLPRRLSLLFHHNLDVSSTGNSPSRIPRRI